MKISCIIPAAGIGRRFKSKDKLFLNLCKKPVIVWTLETVSKHPLISEIILVVNRSKIKEAKTLVQKYNLSKVKEIIEGGKTRQESVYLGLQKISPLCNLVVIHDGGRPLLSNKLLKKVILCAKKENACCPVVPVSDTVKEIENYFIKRTIDREKIYFAQTPQVFNYELIMKAHKKARENNFHSTDDASLVEQLGKKVKVILGDKENIKITTKDDLLFAEMILKKRRKNNHANFGKALKK